MRYNRLLIKDTKEEESSEIEKEQLVDIPGDIGRIELGHGAYLECRATGSLQYHAIYLPSSFDWILGRDERDLLCLVPLKKSYEVKE